MNRIAAGLITAATLVALGCASQPPPAPVIVQAPTPTPTPKAIPPSPYDGLPANVVAAIKTGRPDIIHDGIATIYRYQPNRSWKVNCQPLYATQILLKPGETTDDSDVIVRDLTRWSAKV